MIPMLKEHSILYVEDEPEIHKNVTEYLENHFGSVYPAYNGQEALNQYHAYRPDVLLVDINLPAIDGLTVAQEIRKDDPNIKIVVLTAFTEKEKLLRAIELKLTKYLIKPVHPKAFKETLRTLSEELLSNSSQFLALSDRCTWDKQKEQLSLDGENIVLTEKEHRLLKLFIFHKGKPVNYEKIVITLWDDAYDREISIDSIKNQVSQLRKKTPNVCIRSVYGEGYILK